MNPLIVFSFIVTTLITFVIVVVVSRPSAEEKVLDKRLNAIKMQQGEFAPVTDQLDLYLKHAEPGNFGWLEAMFAGTAFSRSLQLLIVQADRQTSVGTVLMSSVGIGLGAMFGAFVFTQIIYVAIPAGVIGAYSPFLLLKFRRGRRIAKFNSVLADCIDMMSRSLRAGHSLVGAIGMLGEEGPEPANFEFGEVFKKQNYGLPLRDALMQLLDRVPSQDLCVLVTGILVQKDTGGNLVDILDRIVNVIRERIRIQGEIKTHTAQGRMTGWILCALPVAMLGIINIVNPGYSNVLFHDPMGEKMLGLGVALLCIGGFVIRSIINGIEV